MMHVKHLAKYLSLKMVLAAKIVTITNVQK